MKMTVKGFGIAVLAVMLVLGLAGCKEPEDPPSPPPPPVTPTPTPTGNVINIAAIKGVIVPAYGLTPVTVITENEQYSGTVKWNDNPSTFAPSTVYTATITLTPKAGYTLQGVTADFFTVIGASVRNVADSGVVTAVFPSTYSKLVNKITINEQPTKLAYEHGDMLDLTGLEITLIYDDGSKLPVTAGNFPLRSITTDPAQGDKLDYLTHNGQPIKIAYGNLSSCKTNNLSNNPFTSVDNLNAYLRDQPDNIVTSPYSVALNVNNLTGVSLSSKYVNIDLSGSTFTSIGDRAFYKCHLTSIIIPDSVTRIGNYAFSGCDDLTSIIIPDSVTRIGNYAFSGCDDLTSIIIPNSVTRIGDYAFNGCGSLTSITIPNSVTSIGDYAFDGCDITSIIIPNSVTRIGDGAFLYCESLTAINVDTNNTAYCSQDGVLYNKDKTILITYPKRKSGSFTIPNSVTSIGDYVFSGCYYLTSIIIPNSVTRIGDEAFDSCTSLTSVTFQGTITSNNFNSYAFGFWIGYIGDLRDKYFANGGGIGTYTRSNSSSLTWTKQ
jgi:hypothetical protein